MDDRDDGRRGSGRSVPAARLDDDDIYKVCLKISMIFVRNLNRDTKLHRFRC